MAADLAQRIVDVFFADGAFAAQVLKGTLELVGQVLEHKGQP